MENLNVPTHVQAKLPEDWTVQDVVDAGEEGLTAIDGIGPSYARRMVEAATAIVASQSDANTPDLPEAPGEQIPADDTESSAEVGEGAPPEEPDDEPQIAPPPKYVEVKLVGVETAVVGLHSLWRGETRRVLYPHYTKAAANHPGAFLVRRDASEPWGEQLS